VGKIQLHAILGVEPFVLRVPNHPDDLDVPDRLIRRRAAVDPLAYGIRVGPVALDHLLIHHDDGRGAEPIAVVDEATLLEWNA
jgi:hypothetical protein